MCICSIHEAVVSYVTGAFYSGWPQLQKSKSGNWVREKSGISQKVEGRSELCIAAIALL